MFNLKKLAVSLTVIFLIALMSVYYATGEEEKISANAECANCHIDPQGVLPTGHAPVDKIELTACFTCHNSEGSTVDILWIVHFNHYVFREKEIDCQACHQFEQDGKFRFPGVPAGGITLDKNEIDRLAPYYKSSGSSTYLDHSHALKKLHCRDCHGVAIPREGLSSKQCLKCHGSYEQLLAKEGSHGEATAPHFGEKKILDCSDCHSVHKESIPVCRQCH